MPSSATSIRQTGAIIKVIEDHVNEWEDFGGLFDINVDVTYRYVVGSGPDEWEQDHWSYRGQASMCITANGAKIVRVRLGDGTSSDRKIYKQEITDPTDAAQWASWTVWNSDDNYAVAIEATTGSSFRILHAKSDGLYADNVKKITWTNIVRVKPVNGLSGALYFQRVTQDFDGDRLLDWYYVADISAVAEVAYVKECANYRWYRSEIGAIYFDGAPAAVWQFRGIAMNGGARHHAASQYLLSTWWSIDPVSSQNTWDNADILVGPSGEAGFKVYNDIYVTDQIDDIQDTSFPYYLFFTETFEDSIGNSLSNLLRPLFWCRTTNIPQEWTEPTPVGYSVWGFAGAIKFGSYIYACGNGRVLRRSTAYDRIDISNYVLEGSFEIPRDNEPATGTLTCANPDNAVGDLLGLISTTDAGKTERRVELKLGIREQSPTTSDFQPDPITYDAGFTYDSGVVYGGMSSGSSDEDTTYDWKELNAWWTARLRKTHDENRDRVEVTIGDFWHRLQNPFSNTISVPGSLHWTDWSVGGQNQLPNYANDGGGEIFRIAATDGNSFTLLTTTGNTLFGGWIGENVRVLAFFYSDTGKLLFRYQDSKNYWYVEYDGAGISLGVVENGDATIVGPVAISGTGGFWLEVRARWNHVDILFNDTPVPAGGYDISGAQMVGSVGVAPSHDLNFEISDFEVQEYNRSLMSSDLASKLLHYVEEFHVVIDSTFADAIQIAKHWGPQSDLDTPAKALTDALGTGKADVVWRDYGPDSDPDVPYIWIGRFGDEDPAYSIENEVINQAQVSEGTQRPNVVIVDGNVNSWRQYDRSDLTLRDRTVNNYIDDPSLLTPGDVRRRAEQEIQDATRWNSPGGDVVWKTDYNRLDTVFWVDADGNIFRTRIEGLSVEWNQSTQPFQHATIDAGAFVFCPPTEPVTTYLARDLFQRAEAGGWGSAPIGGDWTVS